MKNILYIFLSLTMALIVNQSHAQIQITEISSDGVVELLNTSNDPVDLSGYWLCDRPAYEAIGNLSPQCGSIMLAAGEIVAIQTSAVSIDPSNGEMGIYSSSSFGSSDDLVDYVIWGDRSGNSRESVATGASLWVTGERATAFENGQSIIRISDNNNAAAWAAEASTICESSTDGEEMATATYRVIFDALWSEASHPFDFPTTEENPARFSPVAGLTHNSSVRLFNNGDIATQGLVNISQTGSRDPLNTELAEVINSGAGEYYIESPTRVRPSPDTISTTFEISESHSLVSLTSMIAPSPDWIVAVRDLNLFQDGEFVENKIVQFIPYDTGSDSGEFFASENEDTQPREGITEITDGPLAVDGRIASIGFWRFERIDANSQCDVAGGSIVGGPFNFTVDGEVDNIPADGITLSGNTGANSQWVITDDQGYILGLPGSFTGPNFDAAGPGLCYVYHLSYEDGLLGLEAGSNIADLDGCFNLSNEIYVKRTAEETNDAGEAVGAVFAMTNGEGQVDGNVQGPNAVVAFAQAADGTLTEIGSFPTGGNGGDFDGGEGLDPLISAYAITKSLDNKFVLAVNAGSNTVTSMRVNEDFSLTVADTESTIDVGPNSIAYIPSRRLGVNGLVYVSNITRDEFLALGEPGQQGSITGYWLLDDGSLEPIDGSTRNLANRPSAIQFSPDGDFVVVASINAGAAALGSGSEDEVVVYAVAADGTLSESHVGAATSTLRGNAEGRNLPSAIGFQIVDNNILVVTEAREFQPDGTPPAFPALQDGSVSTWQIENDGSLTAINLDVASGVNNTGRTACWLDFSDENTFFVSNAIEAGLASYSFDNGNIELINQTAAQGTGATGNTTDGASAFATTEGWIDLWISDDGKFLYQAYGLTGEVGVFAIDGAELTLIQEIGGLPSNNIQGIVAVGPQQNADEPTAQYRVTFDALWSEAAHPVDFPTTDENPARFSPVAGLTHNSSVRLFNEGDIASEGLVNISQTGSRDPLDTELASVINSGAGEFYIESATRVRPSPDTISTTFEISGSHSLVSLTSMIAPSPDWIVAVRDLDLFQDGDFVESKIVQFIPYDTGSDSGESYASDNQDTQPREGITEITDGPLAVDGRIASIGIWRFERIDANSQCDVAGGSIVGGPYNFTVDGVADNIPADGITLSGNSGANSQWVITDDQGYILGLPGSFTGPNFDAAGPGLCYVYHLSYEDGLTGLNAGNNIADLDGCFDLSNEIYVKRTAAETGCDVFGGVIESASGVTELTFCVGDGRPNPMDVRVADNSGANSVFVVTDEDLTILAVQSSNRFDFEGQGEGVCLIWHLSYEEGITGASLGQNAADIEGCFDLSNPITVNRVDCNDQCHTPFNVRLSQAGGDRVNVRWDRVASADSYEVEISFTESNRVVVVPTSSRLLRVTLRDNLGDLQIRVRAICGDGNVSDYSDTEVFEGAAVTSLLSQTRAIDTNNELSVENFTVSPNPAQDFIQISIDALPANTQMSIMDSNGKRVRHQNIEAGNMVLDIDSYQSGLYMILLQSEGKVLLSERFIKI